MRMVNRISPDTGRRISVWRSTRMRAHLALEQHDAAVEDCSWMQRQLGRATTERIADGALILSNLFERESCRRKLATAL